MDRLIGAYWLPQPTLTFRSDLLSCRRSLCVCICSLLALCALCRASRATWRTVCDQQRSEFEAHSCAKLAFRVTQTCRAHTCTDICTPVNMVFGGPRRAPSRPGPSGCSRMDAAPKPSRSNRRLLAPTLKICFLHLKIEQQDATGQREELFWGVCGL